MQKVAFQVVRMEDRDDVVDAVWNAHVRWQGHLHEYSSCAQQTLLVSMAERALSLWYLGYGIQVNGRGKGELWSGLKFLPDTNEVVGSPLSSLGRSSTATRLCVMSHETGCTLRAQRMVQL